jgi:hypothetical protein
VFIVNPSQEKNHWLLVVMDLRGEWTSALPIPVHVYDSMHHLGTDRAHAGEISETVQALQTLLDSLSQFVLEK